MIFLVFAREKGSSELLMFDVHLPANVNFMVNDVMDHGTMVDRMSVLSTSVTFEIDEFALKYHVVFQHAVLFLRNITVLSMFFVKKRKTATYSEGKFLRVLMKSSFVKKTI